jgi:hypothetical protein
VEPNYEKKLETLEELLDSDVVYGYHPAINYALDTFSFPELSKFEENVELKEDCSDVWKCVEKKKKKRDMVSVNGQLLFTYVAREMGVIDVGKLMCTLDQYEMTVSATVGFKKGNPLLDRFNFLMRRYLEAGLMEMLWTELQHLASLRGAGRFTEAVGDKVFAFSVSHLMPAIVVLLVGTVLSSAVFIVEVIVNCLYKGRGNVIRAFRD